MEQIVKVRRICENGQAEVEHIRRRACSGDCHHCAGCGAATQTMIVRAENPIHAPVGAMVTLRADTAGILGAAATVYLLPLVLFFAGYALGAAAESFAGLWGCAGFAAGILAAVAADRRNRKTKKTVYTITGYALCEDGADSKGEHQLD